MTTRPWRSLERYIHEPSATGLGDSASVRCIFIARTDLFLGGGRTVPAGSILEPGLIRDPHLLVRTRKAWALAVEPLAILLDAQAATPAAPPESTTNARARARVEPFQPGAREAPSVVGSTSHRGSRLREARAWLQAALANGARPAAELYAEADAAGHSRRNIERAAAELGIESFQERRAWRKRLPESGRQFAQTGHAYARAREETTE